MTVPIALLVAAGAALPVLHDVKDVEKAAQGEVVVLHFWATWCVPCRKEWPALGKLLGKYQKRVRVVSLSLDPPAKAEEAKRFLREVTQLPHEAFLLDAEADAVVDAVDPSWDGELPATFVYTRGRRVASYLGRADLSALREDLDRAVKLVREPAPD